MKDNESVGKNVESENKKMFRARFDIFVLNALYEHDGASYGYDVINYIQSRTKGHYKIKTFSTIYNTLKRLEENGYVISGEGDGKTNGATRVYYALTEKGKEYLEENKTEYMYLRTLLDNLLTDEDFDLENGNPPLLATNLKPLTKRNRVASDIDGVDRGVPVEVETTPGAVSEEVAAETAVIPASDVSSHNDILVSPTNNPVVNSVKPKTVSKKNADVDYKAVFERLTYPILNSTPKKQTLKRKPTPSSVSQSEKKASENDIVVSASESPVKFKEEKAYVSAQPDVDAFESNITKLKRSFKNDGYNLSVYKADAKADVDPIHYIYINKYIRDTVVLTALFLVIVSLSLFLARSYFGFTLTGLLVCCAVACVLALVAVLVWFKAPEKRRKDGINFKALNAGTIGFFTLFFMMDLIISLLIVNGKGLRSPEIYVPILLASPVVIFGLLATLLHKSERYFQK